MSQKAQYACLQTTAVYFKISLSLSLSTLFLPYVFCSQLMKRPWGRRSLMSCIKAWSRTEPRQSKSCTPGKTYSYTHTVFVWNGRPVFVHDLPQKLVFPKHLIYFRNKLIECYNLCFGVEMKIRRFAESQSIWYAFLSPSLCPSSLFFSPIPLFFRSW